MTDSTKAVPRPKTSRACEPCRALKVRCLPGSHVNVCKKCSRSGAKCYFEKPRPRRKTDTTSSKARVIELESKLNELIARVDKHAPVKPQSAGQDDSALGSQYLRAEDSPTIGASPHFQESYSSGPTTASIADSRPGYSTPSNYYADYPRINATQSVPDLLFTCSVSIAAADEYLMCFRSMTNYFPFVMIPHGANVLSLSRDRPFLCLAALSAATSADKLLQKTLEQSFRISILQKVMLDGERSLDILDGLLIYLAWYHFYYMPKEEQSYQLLQMAVGMCIDLGLNHRPEDAMDRPVGLRLSHYRKASQSDVKHDEFFSREARRAYLGCYYLSTNTAWVGRKPSTMQYSVYMAECGASLMQELEYPTDATLLALVQLQHMAEENHGTLCMASNRVHDQMSTQRIKTHMSSFQVQLQCWESSLAPVPRHSVVIDLAYHLAKVHVHEMDLINPFRKKEQKAAAVTGSKSCPSTASVRLDVLLLCLEATKGFCESFVTISVEEYRNLSYIQWSALVFTTVILYKLSIGVAHLPEWDARVARASIDIEQFLETLCARILSVSHPDAGTLDSADLFSMMGLIFANVKQTYDRLKCLPQAHSVTDINPVHATRFPNSSISQLPLSTKYQHPCPAFQFWKAQGADMTMFEDHAAFSQDMSVDKAGDGELFLGDEFVESGGMWPGLRDAASGRDSWKFQDF